MITKRLQNILLSDWVVVLLLFLVFLATNGYTYGWDDQHLEIPLLKSLIDPELYAGDYYVESLKRNFTSILYPFLARILSIDLIPSAYLFLYLLSRYFLFFWMYKLWRFISESRFTAALCVMMVIVLGRVEEFLYRTFSHQEFALALIFAGFYYFYRERYYIAAFILGIAANIHALYSLFPFLYMLAYILFTRKTSRIRISVKVCLVFFVSAMPLFFWVFRKLFLRDSVFDAGLYENWIALYKIACPQNFIFHEHSLQDVFGHWRTFIGATREYWLLLVYYLLNVFHNEKFRKDLKCQTMIVMGLGFLIFSFVFSYIFPSRFIIDLNLIRNSQYLLFILAGYTIVLLVDTAQKRHWSLVLGAFLLLPFIRFGGYVSIFAIAGLNFTLSLARAWRLESGNRKKILSALLLAFTVFCAGLVLHQFITHRFSSAAKLSLWLILSLLAANATALALVKNPKKAKLLRHTFVVIPFFIFSVNYMYYHRLHARVEKEGEGFWQMQRNWIDMQNYVKEHTPKNALLLVPHDMEMGGFRIFSERKIICSYRDCGIIGFDYAAAKEWQNRLKDIEGFQVFIKKPVTSAVTNAVVKYRVNYIVFMRYLDPGANSLLDPVYKNEVFVLYQVKNNPV